MCTFVLVCLCVYCMCVHPFELHTVYISAYSMYSYALNTFHLYTFPFSKIYNLWTVMDCLGEQESACVSCAHLLACCTFI